MILTALQELVIENLLKSPQGETPSTASNGTLGVEKGNKQRKKRQQTSPEVAKPKVTIQPWLCSTVWDTLFQAEKSGR
jgi:hypothetical protein